MSCMTRGLRELIFSRNQLFPFFTDLWGYKINWLDPEDGWDNLKRSELLKLHLNNIKQPDELTRYTKMGYKKVKIPTQLYQVCFES